MRLATFLITFIIIISSFIIIPNYTLSTASAAQLSYSDTAYENGTVSYYNTSTTSPSATTLTIQSTANTTATDLNISSTSHWTKNSAYTEAWFNITSGNPIGFHVYQGTKISLNAINFEAGGNEASPTEEYSDIGKAYMTVTIGSTQITTSHTYDKSSQGALYVTFAPSITSTVGGEITALSFNVTYFEYTWNYAAPTDFYTETKYTGNTTSTANIVTSSVPIPFVYGYTYQNPVVSSFSSQVPPYLTSFKIYWSAQYPTEAIYPYTYPITINNPPSGSGYYQQLFTFSNPSQYGINSAGSNILFSLSNGTNLYAWIESINSSSMNVWVKVPYGTTQIDMNVYPSFENLFSATGYLGEAPQLSPTYAEYDNGADVFPFYDNFAGTTLNSDWTVLSGITATVDNGITVGGGGSWTFITNSHTLTNPSIIEMYGYAKSSGGIGVGGYGSTGGGIVEVGASNFVIETYFGSGVYVEGGTASANTFYLMSLYYVNNAYLTSNYSTTEVSTNYTSINNEPIEIAAVNTGGFIQWIRTRSYLPNGMPTYSIGSPVSPTTSSPITGIVGQYGISFAPNTQDIPVTSYTVTYNITFVATRPNSATETATTSYSITQATDGIYFNASFSFSWSFSNPTLYVSSSYPISWYVNVSHLLNEYPSYASNTVNFGISPATYSRATYGSDSTQYFDFIYYYNSTSSSADSVTFTVTTSELVNNYPTITYASLKYSGHGSTEVLTVNASNPFKNETLQLTNVNWGDGSPTQNSPIETPVGKNYYNFTLTHQYDTTGTFTVTLLVVNAVGNSASLSSSAHGSISLSISINYTSNALPVKTNTRIFFNYTQINVNVQNVYLYINNILVQANNTTSNTNYNGAVSYVIPYYLTQTAEFDAKWLWTAGGISGSQVIQYSV
ncbi:MAG: hypothetical protein QXU98_11520, partial [Candidatus Parvarchaeota archaeon]